MESPSTPDRSVSAYASVVDDERIEGLRDRANDLENVRVLHVNSTAQGGGVAELLESIVPLSNDLGVETDWLVMEADEPFFDVTKAMHNGLQGEDVPLTAEMKAQYRSVTERNAAAVDEAYDVIALHDPQTLGMIDVLAERFPNTTFVWRCHIDLSSPDSSHLEFIAPFVERVDHAVFTREVYGTLLDAPDSSVIHPSIDPLTDKNRPLSSAEETAERERLEPISFDDPVVAHVSRFDPWKDQLGILEAYRKAKSTFPNAQLALLGGTADDDPEGAEVFERVEAAAADDPDVHLLTNQPDTTVNFLQRHADVVVQKSLREGFGLVVSEALWKRTPVIGSTVGGIPLQIEDGKNGYLLEPDDIEGVADRIERLLGDAELRRKLGDGGRETVLERFVLLRQLQDYLELFTDLTSPSSGS